MGPMIAKELHLLVDSANIGDRHLKRCFHLSFYDVSHSVLVLCIKPLLSFDSFYC